MSAARLLSASAAIGLAVMVAGCEATDRIAMTEFTPRSDGTFTYRATADAVYRLDSPGAEETRLRWLDQYIESNGLCEGGYEIVERTPVVVTEGLFGGITDIIYEGQCTT